MSSPNIDINDSKLNAEAAAAQTAAASANEEDMQARVDDVMKKFDRESNVRLWEGAPKQIVNGLLVAFSLFCIYVTLWGTLLEEVRLTSFMACIVFLGYLIYPARKGVQKVNYIPWYDIILMVCGTGSFLYFMFNAVKIIQQGSKFSDMQIAIGVVGIICLAEVCRRSVGLPILIVASAFIIYALTTGLSNPTFARRLNYAVRLLFHRSTRARSSSSFSSSSARSWSGRAFPTSSSISRTPSSAVLRAVPPRSRSYLPLSWAWSPALPSLIPSVPVPSRSR